MVDNVYIDFGGSMLYHENEFIQFFMYSAVELVMVVIENSSYFFGQATLTDYSGPILA